MKPKIKRIIGIVFLAICVGRSIDLLYYPNWVTAGIALFLGVTGYSLIRSAAVEEAEDQLEQVQNELRKQESSKR